MKRWKKIIGGTLVLLLAVGAGTAWQFRNEIQAVRYFLKYSSDQQQELEQENEKTLEAILEQANLPADVFGDPSLSQEELEQKLAEKQQQVQSGGVDDKNSGGSAQLANNSSTAANTPAGKPGNSSNQPAKESGTSGSATGGQSGTAAEQQHNNNQQQQAYDAELAAMVGEIYALRNSFTGQLDDLLQQAKAEYGAMSPEDREKKKSALASKYIGLAGSLESSCDSQMEEILGRIQKHLKETGGDPSLVKEFRKVYENEKALKKSSYMEMLR